MAKSSVYSAQDVVLVVSKQKVIGLWDGDDAVTVEPGVDVGEGLVGIDGSSIFSQSADNSATITIKLQHTSAAHRLLTQLYIRQKQGGLNGFPVSCFDVRSGEGGATSQAFIATRPTDAKGSSATSRDWVLWCGDWTLDVPN